MKKADLLRLLEQVPEDAELAVPGDEADWRDPWLSTLGRSQSAELNRVHIAFRAVEIGTDGSIAHFFETLEAREQWLADRALRREYKFFRAEPLGPVTVWDIG